MKWLEGEKNDHQRDEIFRKSENSKVTWHIRKVFKSVHYLKGTVSK